MHSVWKALRVISQIRIKIEFDPKVFLSEPWNKKENLLNWVQSLFLIQMAFTVLLKK